MNWLPFWIDFQAQKPTLILHPTTVAIVYNCPLYCGRKIIGKILLPLIFGVIIFEFFVITTILLPYESHFSSTLVTYLYGFLIVYFVVNTLYHYIKARTLHPGAPVRSKQEPICRRCHTHKPRNASHCSICDTCIVDMDHHCIWINNCVGAGNVRHFFLFIAFIAIGAIIWLPIAWRAYKNHRWNPEPELFYCNLNLEWSWSKYLCEISPTFVSTCIKWSFIIGVGISLFTFSLFFSAFILISNKMTYLEVMKYGHPNDFLTTHTPWRRDDFIDTWIDFLGLRRGRSFWRHVLLPSGHRPSTPLHYEEDFTSCCDHDLREYQKIPLITV